MGEAVFLKPERGLTLEEIVALTGAEPVTGNVGDRIIRNVTALEFAGPDDLAFADRGGDAPAVARTQAGACLVAAGLVRALPARTIALRSDDPYRAFVQVANALYPDALRPSSLFEIRGNAASATLHSTARIEPNVTIDPGAIVGPRAEIGSGTVIGPLVVIGPDVRVGRACVIGPGASVMNSLIGDGVVIRAGCRLGEDRSASSRPWGRRSVQLGRVILQDGVQLGANCTIDRGSHVDTVMGEGTVVDNSVHIPAETVIGRHCAIRLVREAQPGSELLSTFVDNGVIPDHTEIDAYSIASLGGR